MNVRNSFLTRCLALVLALVLVVSNANLGVALQVMASENASLNVGEIVANNYDELSAAEKALLGSGNLIGGTYAYEVPTDEDNLVSIDTENKKITAEKLGAWVPVSAEIVVGSEVKETVALDADCVGTYTFAENAFSVKVNYALADEFDANVQETLLNTAGWLKQGVAQMDTVAALSSNLVTLELAMPKLLELRDMSISTALGNVGLSAGCKTAINALNNQMQSNGGKFVLSTMINEYKSSSKTQYLLTKGLDMKAEIEALVGNVQQVSDALYNFVDYNQILIDYGFIDAALVETIIDLAGSCGELATGLEAAKEGNWTAAEKGTALVSDTVNYGELDLLVAALGATTVPAVKNPLDVATASVTLNMAMFDVTVKVVLNTVVGNVVTENATVKEVKITLGENATAAEIVAAVAESGVEAAAIAAWGSNFVEGQYEATATELPATLTEDITYVITYNPVEYTVDIAGNVNNYPYGYVVTLPEHEDENKSYDYHDANGDYVAQGTKVTVDKDLTFTRTTGKAYTNGNLLTILAGNYASGNDKVTAIMTSGALNVDESFNYRKPSTEELENLVKLEGNVLTAKTYPSSYKGLSWAPATYEVDGVSKNFGDGESVTIEGEFDEVYVFYTLVLENYTKAQVEDIFKLVETLNTEAAAQKSILDRLAGFADDMSMLNGDLMSGLQGMVRIDAMKVIIGNMLNDCFVGGMNLKLNGIIDAYNNPNGGGLYYYYTNDEYVRGEINLLKDYLDQLLLPEYRAELERLLGNFGYGDKVVYLDTLSSDLDEILTGLYPTNDAIITSNSGALIKLVDALNMPGDVKITNCDSPFISMEPVYRAADKYTTVTINLDVNGTTNTNPITAKVLKGTKLSNAQVAELKAAVAAFVEGTGINTKYFNTNYAESELNALASTGLDANVTFEYTWTKATYTVEVPGKTQTVDIDDLTIELPAHSDSTGVLYYEYTVDGATASEGIYTLTVAQLDKLIAGNLTIERVEKNRATDKLINMVNSINTTMGFESLVLVEEDGVYTGINATMGMDNMMDFIMGLVTGSGYGYIGLDNEGFKYATADGLEISMQALINALLSDEGFNNDRVIELAKKGKGTFLTTTMQLGDNADSAFSLDFTLNLNSVPAEMSSNVGYLQTASNYLHFYGKNDTLNVEIDLPDQIYAAYAVALVAAGEAEKTNVNDINNKVAVQFLYDYVTAITGSDMDLITFQNTLDMLGVNFGLAQYNNYYTAAIAAYNEKVTVEITDDVTNVNVSVPGKAAIDALIGVAGMDMGSFSDVMGMIKEYKAGGEIKLNTSSKLVNTDKSYKALVIDAQADGVTNKFAAPTSASDLNKLTKKLSGYSVVILLDDVDGDLNIKGTTVLDLNGKTVDGAIKATGNLFIIDSTMDTYNAGTVTEGVTGNATIIAGNYGADVSAYLKAGYYMDDTTVRNNLYKIVADNDSVEFVLNADAVANIPHVTALAIDIAADLVLNYGYFGSLGFDGYSLIDMHITDLIGLYDTQDLGALASELASCITIGVPGYENQDGFEALVNTIIADLINFEKITEGLTNNTPVVEHEITHKPWKIDIAKAEAGNYVTVNIGTNEENAKTTTFGLTIESSRNASLAELTGELAAIVEDRTEILIDVNNMPEVTGGYAYASLAGKANVYVDMSANEDYAVAIAVMIANANPAKRAAVAAAINDNNTAALKAVIDNTSAAELIKALKNMKTNVSFTSMARTVGVTANVQSAAELEALFHTILCGLGKVLSEAAVTGTSTKLGTLYNEETGYYTVSLMNLIGQESYATGASADIGSYLAVLELTASELSLNIKLFGDVETCMIGDVNHDYVVDGADLVLMRKYLAEFDTPVFCFRGADVNGDGTVDGADLVLMRKYLADFIDQFPAESM